MIDWIEGEPYSRRFGDVYFSRLGGIEEKRHVFLAGNRLPERFAQLPPAGRFVIGETGFGTGLNFLCAWQLFEASAPPLARLHFVSTELIPLSRDDFARAVRLWPELVDRGEALLAQWDELAPGWHRFAFDRVTLTLLVGDARATLPELDAEVDAWFLDGFTPARNPELWTPELMHCLSRLSHAGTTCATYSSAGQVRRDLEAAGFRVERAPGFGPKREMLVGECASPRPRPYRAPWLQRPEVPAGIRDAIVIGGGLAGTAAAASLARRGILVTLLERRTALAAEASGNAQGVLYVKLSPHDTALSRLLVAGYQFSLREIARRLPQDGEVWARCGVLQLGHDAAEASRQAQLAAQGWPDAFLRTVDHAQACALAGVEVASGGLFFGQGGWVHPPALCAAFTNTPRVTVRPACDVSQLERLASGRWRVLTADGGSTEAALVVLATAADTTAFGATSHLPTHVIRGQLTHLPVNEASARLASVVCGEGYVAPSRRGMHCLGATFGIRDAGVDVRPEDHSENLSMLRALSPALADAFAESARDAGALTGRAGLRCVAPDYLPIVGPLASAAEFAGRFARLAKDATTRFECAAPWLEGLFVSVAHGSRGLVTAPIAGELIAAQALGEPAPLPANVVDALSPSRFLARGLKRAAR